MKDKEPLYNITIEDVYNMIKDFAYEKSKDNLVIYTGIEGFLNYEDAIISKLGGSRSLEDRAMRKYYLLKQGQTIFKL